MSAGTLAAAKVVDSLDEAIGDCVLAVGTSARSRRIPLPLADAQTVASRLADEYAGQPVAILFGRETSGLTNEELQRCQLHLAIPASPEYPSLNLAMSVQVVCYELFKARSAPQPPATASNDATLASLEEVEGFLAHFESVLRRIDFLKSSAPRQAMTRLRRMFGRIGLEQVEVGMLRGILTHFWTPIPSGHPYVLDIGVRQCGHPYLQDTHVRQCGHPYLQDSHVRECATLPRDVLWDTDHALLGTTHPAQALGCASPWLWLDRNPCVLHTWRRRS